VLGHKKKEKKKGEKADFNRQRGRHNKGKRDSKEKKKSKLLWFALLALSAIEFTPYRKRERSSVCVR
jgi:hypothetical protein